MVAGVAGGRRVPAGYDAGTYPIAAPYRPEAMPSHMMVVIARVEAARRADRAELEALKARVVALEAERSSRVDWSDLQQTFFAICGFKTPRR